jgi:PAS domain S-box-containing protein
MSRVFWRRLLVTAISLVVGLSLAEGIRRLFFPQSNGWILFCLLGILAAALGLFLDLRLAAVFPGPFPPSEEIQTDLLQLNRELEERASLHQSELARLNVELTLQIARHQQAEGTARLNEERFRNLADNIQEGLSIVENGKMVYMNERVCEIFGKCPEGDLRQRVRDFATPEEAARINALLTRKSPPELQYWIRRPDGKLRCIREHYSTVRSEEGRRLFIVTSDVTERAQAYQNLEQAVGDRTRELSTVLEISQRIASTLELEPLLNLILDQIASIIPYSGAAIYTLEENSRLKVAAYQLPNLPHLAPSLSLPLEYAGRFRPVVTEKRVIIIEDVRGEPPLAQAHKSAGLAVPSALFQHSHSWIGIPLLLRGEVMGLLSLTHEQPGYYTETHTRLAQAVSHQIAVAIENARLYEQAQDLATLGERNRIARELHDSVTQLLYGISLLSTAASHSANKGNVHQAQENLTEIKDNALQALQEMRLLILELNPPLLQKHGLAAALKASLESIESRAGLETELHTDGVERLPRAVEPDVYRIAMEALNNLVRYARAKKVTVDLQTRSDWIILDIRDNGVGFDIERVRDGGGMGIHNMEQRAKRLGGRLEISSRPGEGTRIKAEIPLLGHSTENSDWTRTSAENAEKSN